LGGGIAEAFPWNSYDACLQKTLGARWETLVEETLQTDNGFAASGLGQTFGTPSGKFEFLSLGTDKTRRRLYREFEMQGEATAFPLMLIPYDSMRLANGYVGNPPFMVKTLGDTVLKGQDCFVEVNPKTAEDHGLVESEIVMLSTPKGEVQVKIHLSDGIMPGLVALPRGLGHTAYDNFLANKGVNFNQLIGPVEDPVSGLDAAWGIRAKLSKIEA
jgi:anaerobic selenocysteine-containing dehydrogenase